MTKFFYATILLATVFVSHTNVHSQEIKKVTEKDKQALLKEISQKLFDATPIISPFADGKGVLTIGDITYFKITEVLRKKDLEEIKVSEANDLFYRAQGKLGSIDDRYRFSLHDQKDSRSILFPVEKLKKYVDSLYNLGLASNHKTGMRVVFGSYDFSGATADQTKSGRLTAFLVGTIDTLATNTYNSPFYWRTQKDITLYSDTTRLILLPRNHGDLCPNSCLTENTIYRKD